MRKLLIAVASLGLMAGGAAAMDGGGGLSLSGSAGLGVEFTGEGTDGSDSKFKFNQFAKVTFKGEGVTDGGLTFGMKVRVNTNKVDDGEVHIGGESWTVTFGDVDQASDLALSLGDVGFDGNVGVDNVAEGLADNKASQARVDVTLGMATIGFSVGQEDIAAIAGRAAVTGRPAQTERAATYQGTHTIVFTSAASGDPTAEQTSAPFTVNSSIAAAASDFADVPAAFTLPANDADAAAPTAFASLGNDRLYVVGRNVYQVVGAADQWKQGAESDDPALRTAQGGEDRMVGTIGDLNGDTAGEGDIARWRISSSRITEATTYRPPLDAVEAVDAVMARAADQETHWALGGKVDLGVATIGFGYDSDKTIQASVGGDFGQFGGSVYYAQQKDDTDTKHTSLGAQVDIAVGEGTTITTVVAQNEVDGAADKMQGFGLGVKHALGGGATVEAGFGKVKDVNKAGVGVVMSF